MHHAGARTIEQYFFLHFFPVLALSLGRGAKKRRPRTGEHYETFKIIKEYTHRSRSRPPQARPPASALASVRVQRHAAARTRRDLFLCLAVCVSLSIE